MILRVPMLLMLCAAVSPDRPADHEGSTLKKMGESSFYVAGYSIRTKNADEMSGRARIGNLWQRFTQQNLAATIPDRLDQRLIVVYADYAGDETGEFTYLLGARVSSIEHLPAQLSYRRIVAGQYSVFTTREGPLVEVLQAEWQKIWSSTPAELGGQRAFVTDYEVYDQRTANPNRAQVEIHVGLKPMGRD